VRERIVREPDDRAGARAFNGLDVLVARDEGLFTPR
jgi:hypothetical protein